MIEFKDIAGLSEPLKRLIEVIAEGIGGVSKPILTRKNADAKAYEIRKIAEAISESQKLLGPIEYEDGKIIVISDEGKEGVELPEATLEMRVNSRMAYQEAKRQSNLELITRHAAEDLDDTEEIGDERPDEDWIARFFRIAEDITSEQMQGLWGKVLAGEVKRPGSFTLRTLDVLKNITQEEAEVFVRVSRFAILHRDTIFVPAIQNGKYLEEQFGIKFIDLHILREIGLLAPVDLELSFNAVDTDSPTIFESGETGIVVDRPAGTQRQAFSIVPFTEIGKQLYQLAEHTQADPEFIEKFASLLQIPGVVVNAGQIESRVENGIRCNDLTEVPGNKPKPSEESKSQP